MKIQILGTGCPKCKKLTELTEAAAKELSLPFLGRIPLQMAIREASDAGQPPAAGEGEGAAAIEAVARRIATWLDNQ